jgi:hypothetical protein
MLVFQQLHGAGGDEIGEQLPESPLPKKNVERTAVFRRFLNFFARACAFYWLQPFAGAQGVFEQQGTGQQMVTGTCTQTVLGIQQITV